MRASDDRETAGSKSCEALMLHSFFRVLPVSALCRALHFGTQNHTFRVKDAPRRPKGGIISLYHSAAERPQMRKTIIFGADGRFFMMRGGFSDLPRPAPRDERTGDRRREKQRVGISSAGRGEHCKYSAFSGYGLLFPAKWYIVIHNSKIVPFCPFFGNEQKFRAQCVKITTPGEGMPQSRSERGKVSERD